MRMHAARRNQRQQMAHPARHPQLANKLHQHRIHRQGTILDRGIDARQFLHHHPPSTDVKMPHLGIAHLPIRQANHPPAGGEKRMRITLPKPVEIRLARQRHRIVLQLGTPAETIQDHQHHRFLHRSPQSKTRLGKVKQPLFRKSGAKIFVSSEPGFCSARGPKYKKSFCCFFFRKSRPSFRLPESGLVMACRRDDTGGPR